MTNNAQSIMFASAPSENNVANVISSQKGTLYLNKPKHHIEEDNVEVPVDSNDTPQDGKPTSSEPTHDWQKRYSDLQSYHDKQIKVKEAELSEKVRLLTEKEKTLEELQRQQTVKLPSTPVEVEEFKTKYKDLYNIVKTIAATEGMTTKAEIEKTVKENEDSIKRLTAEKARAELLEIHPDAMTLKNDPDFLDWYKIQVSSIKALIESPNVEDIARGIDIYKKDKGVIKYSPAQKAEMNKEAAMAVTTKSAIQVGKEGGRIWKASEVKKIPNSQYGKYEAEILKAYAEGRYDENN